ncbi:TolB family protein [Luteimonas cellulosilyticus]|uniref:TolB family protein n=1 Tax=Luteimonas cellulosilyticus TaxID=2683586 RepID=UPI001F3A4B64|nr:hypothetical protein [Luteimonas cellulosilyticus]
MFTSNRAGRFELWWADLARPDTLRPIESLRPDTGRGPSWSADSRHVLVSASRAGGRTAIYEVSPATGLVEELPAPTPRPLQALYLPDPTRMLLLEGGQDGGTRLVLYDRSASPWQALGAIEGVTNARVDASRNSILFTRLDSDGLWEADLALDAGTVRAVADMPSRWLYRNWAPVEGGVVYLHAAEGCRSQLSFLDLATGSAAALRCVHAEARSSNNGISADAAGRQFFVALAEEDGSDIGFMAIPKKSDGPSTLAPSG